MGRLPNPDIEADLNVKIPNTLREGLMRMQQEMSEQGFYVQLGDLVRGAVSQYLKTRLIIRQEPRAKAGE